MDTKKLLIQKEYDIRARNNIPISPKQSHPLESPSKSAFSSSLSSSPSSSPTTYTKPHNYVPLSPKRTHHSPTLQEPTHSPFQLPHSPTSPSMKPREPSRAIERLSSSVRKSPSVFRRSWSNENGVSSDNNSPKGSGDGSVVTSHFGNTNSLTSISVAQHSHNSSSGNLSSPAAGSPRSPLAMSGSFKNSFRSRSPSSPSASSPSGRSSPHASIFNRTPSRDLTKSMSSLSVSSPAPISIPAPSTLFDANRSHAEHSVQQMYEQEARESQSKKSLLWLAREFRARQEFSKAASYYEQLIDLYPVQDDIHFELGEIYHIALKEYRLAAACYRRVLEGNPYHVQTLVNLGLLHFDGLGVTTDRYKAVNLWNRALREDPKCVLALQCIAYCYYSGLGGLPVSYLKARDFADLVLEYADTLSPMERTIASDAAYVLAHMYRRGYDTPRDYQRALHYYEKSAHLGNHRAYLSMARLYSNELKYEDDAPHYFDHYMKQAAKAEKTNEEAF